MNNQKNSRQKKSQVIGCRLPYQVYEDYEQRCIELQIQMSEVLRQAIQRFMKEKSKKN